MGKVINYSSFNYLKGGFAKCYEFVSGETKQTLAGKVIDKQTL